MSRPCGRWRSKVYHFLKLAVDTAGRGIPPSQSGLGMAETMSRIVELPPVVDLDALDGVRDHLLEAIEEGTVTVSGAAVERVSTNALFLLLSAAETARANRSGFFVTSLSASLEAAIDRLGLGPHFDALRKGTA